MHTCCLGADEQLLGDLGIGPTLSYQPQHSLLLPGEEVVPIAHR